MNFELILIWAGIGLVIGTLAKYILPGKDGVGLITTSLLGLLGSVVGVFIANYIGLTTEIGELSFFSFIFAVVGSILLLIIRKIMKFII